MTAALVRTTVDFYGDELPTFEREGIHYVAMKPICDLLGIQWEAQRERIQSDEVLSEVVQIITLHMEGDARAYPLLCLPHEYMQGWLFGIQVKSVRPEHRERLILYKRECYSVLHAAFNRSLKPSSNTPLLTANEIAALPTSEQRQEALKALFGQAVSPLLRR